ncbi:tRNA lysidine(34) synthetase TilS [Desulfovulcanus sp.]
MKYKRLQDLPPKWAHFCLNIQNFIQYKLNIDLYKKTLLVAFSAGPDSMALLRVMHFLSSRLKYKLIAAHLNHGLRVEAGDEEQVAQKACQKLGIPIYIGRTSVGLYAGKTGLGIEEAGRKIRYRFLQGLARKLEADFILTAHQLDDLAEDVLMRLLRGAGWPGLSGMKAFDQESKILRPLLLTPKTKLLHFLKDLGQEYVQDKSNWDMAFLRNRVRLKIIPLFMQENKNFFQTIARLWEMGRIDQDFWQEQLEGVKVETKGREIIVSTAELYGMHKALRYRLYKKILEQLGPGQVLGENLFQVDLAFENRRIGKRFQFPGHKIVQIRSQGIVFMRL